VSPLYLAQGLFPQEILRPTAQYILDVQQDDGCIPWFEGGHADPWDHVESAMGLTVSGEYAAARRAYRWLQEHQLADGSWWVAYRDGQVHDDDRRETNFVAYVATGIWHYYLVTGDREFVASMWPCVEAAMGFVLSLQSIHGDISWAVNHDGSPPEDALITGCSSIYKSLECAIAQARLLGQPNTDWVLARTRLGDALRLRPERFDRTWESKARYSMDWFYPVLTGVFSGRQARTRLRQRWSDFVVDGLGCRCVADEPWVTVAESCELVLALLAAGERGRAAELFSWLYQWRDADGAYWTGYQWVEEIHWPLEKPTWTAAAVLLAADALTGHTAASGLLTGSEELDPAPHQAQALYTR
jgi:hypothetical protein